MAELSREEQFFGWEYQNAAQLTYHIDEMRNKVTGFWLSFVGTAFAGLAILIKGEFIILGEDKNYILAFLFLAIGLIGIIMTCILARLRAVQLEHFAIINNIREFFVGNSAPLLNVVQLSSKTLPKPTRTSGSFYWLQLITLVGALMFGFCAYFLAIGGNSALCSFIWAVGVTAAAYLAQDFLYFKLAQPRPKITYSPEDLKANPQEVK